MSLENREIRWAVLGTGVIANEMAQALKSGGRSVYAVGNRTHEKAVEFAKKYGIGKVYDDFHEMFTDEDVDVIYLTTPHNTHIDFMIQALSNGKHVMCEKSITLNSEELKRAVDLAREKGLVLAEAMTIYHMPLYKKLREIVDSGRLGPVRMIQLNFGSFKEYDMTNRFFNKDLAGGALLDIGVYAISLARYFMTSKPDQVLSQVKYAPSGADEQSGILMMNGQGEMAVISLTLHAKQPKRVVIACEYAYIEIMEYPRAESAVIVHTQTGEREVIEAGSHDMALKYELEDMEAAIRSGSTMFLPYSIDVMDIMTGIRKEWGMYYDSERGSEQ
ncbi:gfo/Idh/MocA family oxidoreductase [Clostridium sp. chh4-2]|uniref:Gfo/Idh/MocA family protein n=1 Tax=Clostridium sp. chh4-2 TaxID=2067550 RepID=UPI000CCF90D8|nr:Gfo/Idh/MocA family oxidoreductase [Clostridium sp. chh4-2]PNV61831.1 gfo/Idh/MocA family oxidoreductase [Clostridium sp. chh4-2]